MSDHRDRHLALDVLARCFVGLADRREQQRVVRHLLTGCEPCRKLAALAFMLASLCQDDFLPPVSPGAPPPRLKIARQGEALLFTCKPANGEN